MIYFLILAISLIIVLSVLYLYNHKFGKLVCYNLGWHLEPTKISNDS